MLRKLAVVALLLLSLGSSGCAPPSEGAPEPPAATQPGTDDGRPLYLVRDTGMRCATHPCLAWVAINVRTGTQTEISGIDVEQLHLDAEAENRTRQQLLAGELHARGMIRTVPNAGPAGDGVVLFVTEVL